ncbi:hypothetical protein [Nonomuraea gerenzanensis]|uniref:Lipoprotein n=1 Tax=Nonomuraea gerenzanensis TaxID=93944 RepID=A0A1M4E0B6_9ACTN|nr:hypothetical protein [Nonomuraea gerenzanensis]UBU14534.1 hypothetical protein LCN96_05775 [Nonomuraea gerenzanensis]SBO92251.1 hypothetical protein BN4615_P1765 [Nonomuraea gerenzanensis]
MKRTIAVAVMAAMTTVMAATPAQADPVRALRAELRAGKGVKFRDVTALLQNKAKIAFLWRAGTWQFGKQGVVASDITATYKQYDGAMFDYMRGLKGGRTIWVNGSSWTTHPVGEAPEGGTFEKDPFGMTGGQVGTYSQLVNPAEPATLKILLQGRKQGRTYAGRLSYAVLAKVSPWFRASFPFHQGDRTVLRYELTLGPDNLPRRLVTSHPAASHVSAGIEVGDGRFRVETTYTGWGSKVSITAPPKSRIA